MSVSFHVNGLERLLRKLDEKQLRVPFRRFFKRAAIRLEGAGKQRAPVDLGTLKNRMRHEIDSAPLPLWAKVGTPAESPTGFPYPLALDEGGITRTYHYVGGGAMGLAGQETKGWFREHAVHDARTDILGYVDDIGSDIKKQWESGGG
jgi:hypothetical protein